MTAPGIPPRADTVREVGTAIPSQPGHCMPAVPAPVGGSALQRCVRITVHPWTTFPNPLLFQTRDRRRVETRGAIQRRHQGVECPYDWQLKGVILVVQAITDTLISPQAGPGQRISAEQVLPPFGPSMSARRFSRRTRSNNEYALSVPKSAMRTMSDSVGTAVPRPREPNSDRCSTPAERNSRSSCSRRVEVIVVACVFQTRFLFLV